jgi:protease-4
MKTLILEGEGVNLMKARIGVVVLVLLAVFILSIIITNGIMFLKGETGLLGDTANVAVIKLDGEIMSEEQPSLFSASSALTPQKVKDFIKKAEDSKMEAIIFEINSPGGTVLATKQIGDEIKNTNLTNVAVVGEVAASGGYWVASNCDYIIADSMSIVGSIGVIGSYLEFSGLMEKYGVGYEQLTAGKYKDAGTPYRPLTDEEKALFQDRLDIIHQEFKNEIAKNRHLSKEQVDSVSEGMFYLGSQAKELGLVDDLGNEDNAKEYLKKKLNVSEINLVEIQSNPSLWQELSKIMSGSFFYMGKGIGTAFTEIKSPVSKIEVYT